MARKRKSKVHLKPEIGIYCEGESEKQYFTMLNQKYRASNIKTKRVKIDSIGESGIRLIEAARKKADYLHQEQVYAVFDRDEKTNDELLRCKKLAKKLKVKILFSSICFEIWILLHFENVMRDYTREELFTKLSGEKYFGSDYTRFKGSSYRQFLFDRVQIAINNAGTLYGKHNDMIKDSPYTNIYSELENIYGKRDVW